MEYYAAIDVSLDLSRRSPGTAVGSGRQDIERERLERTKYLMNKAIAA
jgi:hypothetical protein